MAGQGHSADYGAVSVGGTAVQIVDGTSSRNRLTITNAHATQVLYLGTNSSVTTANGLPVVAGASREFEEYLGPVFGIASGAATDTRYFEVY